MSQTASALLRFPGETIPKLIRGLMTSKRPEGAYVVFAPFDTENNRTLFIEGSPEQVNGPIDRAWFAPTESIPAGSTTTSADEHSRLIGRAKESIAVGQADKIVLARRFVSRADIDALQTFDSLCASYPEAMVWCLNSPETGVWVGATPELLLKSSAEFMHTVSLAGTRASGEPWTDKERREQEIVTEYILKELENAGAEEILRGEVEEVEYGALRHFQTRISFKADSAYAVQQALHPTPAVCGRPKAPARDFILRNEPTSRMLYSGFLGEQSESGDVRLFVNLRCMKLFNGGAMVFAGGGITDQSDIESEVRETERKAAAILPNIMADSES